MNEQQRHQLQILNKTRKMNTPLKMNTFRFAWHLLEHEPHLAVAVLRQFIIQMDKEEKDGEK